MIVTILGQEYTLSADWSDITLSKFQELCKIPVPKNLEARWRAWMKNEDTPAESHKDIVKTFPTYYGKVIELLSDIPHSIVERIEWSLRDKLFNDYLLDFAISTIGLPQYEPVFPKSFRLRDEEFFFPESIDRGGRIPLIKEDIITFAEASDIEIAIYEWGQKGIDAMAQVCAVYLRKDGEKHSDELVLSRTEKFKELPMSVVWELFFCIMRLGLSYKAAMETFSREVIQKQIAQLHDQE